MIGKIERVPLKDVWPHEALDFTTWLEENVDILDDVLGFSLAVDEREADAGDFRVDLLARNAEGELVVIENQLEKSNHDHLGKVLTYLTAFDAKAAVWIVAEARPEHIRAVAWLNESTAASFYLAKVEAVRIDSSPPAPLLTLIVGPSEEARDVGAKKKELRERQLVLREFWTQLLDRARGRTQLHSTVSPGTDHWLGTGAGRAGLSLNYIALRKAGRVELTLQRPTAEGNKAVFDALAAARQTIESEFGGPLKWDFEETRSQQYVRVEMPGGGLDDQENWPQLQDAMIDAMIRLERALRPHINALDI